MGEMCEKCWNDESECSCRSERRLRDMVCPQCQKPFELRWQESWGDDAAKVTLEMRGCPSGGIYDVSIKCPHCDYEEEL